MTLSIGFAIAIGTLVVLPEQHQVVDLGIHGANGTSIHCANGLRGSNGTNGTSLSGANSNNANGANGNNDNGIKGDSAYGIGIPTLPKSGFFS